MLVVNRLLLEVKGRLKELEAKAKDLEEAKDKVLKDFDLLCKAIREVEEIYYGTDETNNLDTSSLRSDEHSSELGVISSGSGTVPG